MKRNQYIFITVPLLIILLLVGMILYRRHKNQPRFWYCSPTQPRGDDVETWQKRINPKLPVSRIDEDFFDQFTISSDEEKFTIDYPDKKRNENPFAFKLRELSSGESIQIGSGVLDCPIIGVICPDANQSKETHVEFHFYDTQLQPMSEEGVIELENNEMIRSRYHSPPLHFPRVMLVFKHEGIEDLILNNIRIYDARTRNLLSAGELSREEKSSCFESNIPLWHNTPVDMVIDASYGPVKTYEFPPVKGEGFAEENFECRLLDVFENVNTTFSTSDEIFKKLKMPQDKLGQQFYLICQPQASGMPVTFELLDKEGNKLTTRGGRTSIYTHTFGLFEPLEKVARVRAHYRPNRYRVVYHFPMMPGLPEENRDIKNLFDVRIPYAMFRGSNQVSWFLQQTLQVSRSRSTGLVPDNSINNFSFPIEFNNVTVRDIAKMYATGATLNVDIQNDQLCREYPVPLLTRINRFIFSKLSGK